MSMLQLDPALPMKTPKGSGLAHVLIDYGPEHHLLWTVFINEGPHAGEIYTYGNPEVRAETNISMGRMTSSDPPQNYTYEVTCVDENEQQPTTSVTLKTLYAAQAPDEGGMKYGPSPNRDYIISLMDEGDVLVRFENGESHIEGSLNQGRLVTTAEPTL